MSVPTSFTELVAPDPETGCPPLNEAQLAAARAESRPQIVIAGPGTGKTRLLTYRTAYLLLRDGGHLRPQNVVVITFSTKAAGQLTRRLCDLLGADGQYVRAGTIHHFCYELVRAHHERLGLPEHFIVADEDVTDAFWQPWCKRNGFKNHRQVKTQVSRGKLGLDALPSRLVRGLRAYEEAMHRRNALDFDDLLIYARDLLQEHDDVRSEVQEACGALLVDEFQDTDPVQYRVIQLAMCPKRRDLFCVADDDQSIYGFRGAQPKNVHRFIEHYGCCREDGTLHVLGRNYRSNHSIFRCAESVLDPHERIKQRGEIEVTREEDAPVYLVECADEAGERTTVRRLVEHWIGQGVPRREIAVLTPWNNLNADYEEHFLRAGIPCAVSGGGRLMETSLMRRLRALLRFTYRGLTGEGAGGETEALLTELLDQHLLGTLKEYAREHKDDDLRVALHDLALAPSAREAVNLADHERQALDSAYALVTNVLSLARGPDVTVGTLVRRVLPHLDGTLGLLGRHQHVLTDPFDVRSLTQAAAALRRWCERKMGRLIVHHPERRAERLWALAARHAFFPGQDHAPRLVTLRGLLRGQNEPLDGDDVVLTPDPQSFGEQAGRASLVGPEAQPGLVLDLAPERRGQLPLGDTAAQPVDDEGRFESRSVRLFKLMQAALAGSTRPLYESYVMVDLETTGLDVKTCRVAEIGALLVEDGEVTGRFERLVRLEGLTDSEAATLRDVCGIGPGELTDADPEENVWRDFCAFVGARPLVAHNGQRFDFRVLERLKRKHRSTVDACWTLLHDMLPDARELFPDLPSHSAEALRRHLLDDATPTAHRALADCEEQQRLLERLQAARARRERMLSLEPLLAAVAVCMTDERETVLQSHESEEAALLRIGYLWTIKGGHPLVDNLQKAMPRGTTAADAVRTGRFADLVEDAPYELSNGVPLDLEARVEALIAPFADQPAAEGGLRALLAHLALWGEQTAEHRGDVVTISTYHSAKGLEFERVVCTTLRDGALPAYYVETGEDRREQRRLLYVGMTRAMTHLVLTYARRGRNGHTQHLSPFLRRLPKEHHVVRTPDV